MCITFAHAREPKVACQSVRCAHTSEVLSTCLAIVFSVGDVGVHSLGNHVSTMMYHRGIVIYHVSCIVCQVSYTFICHMSNVISSDPCRGSLPRIQADVRLQRPLFRIVAMDPFRTSTWNEPCRGLWPWIQEGDFGMMPKTTADAAVVFVSAPRRCCRRRFARF